MPPSQPPPDSHTASVPPVPGDAVAGALGRIPSGLFVVTWREVGRDRGMLASWVMQAGFAPPAVTIAIAPGRDLLPAAAAGAALAVNILGESQRPLLARFGRAPAQGEDPFAGIEIVRTPAGNAAFPDAAGWLEGRLVARADAGDHAVVVVAVVAAAIGRSDAPLVHLRKNGLRY
ncbi:MAG: flavin reductase [Planctomycetia bacterium]|nr:flavin reductase [Planctomycetia bacterium]